MRIPLVFVTRGLELADLNNFGSDLYKSVLLKNASLLAWDSFIHGTWTNGLNEFTLAFVLLTVSNVPLTKMQ